MSSIDKRHGGYAFLALDLLLGGIRDAASKDPARKANARYFITSRYCEIWCEAAGASYERYIRDVQGVLDGRLVYNSHNRFKNFSFFH